MTKQASTQARDFVGQVQVQVRDQANAQTQRASAGLKDVSRQLRGLAEGQPRGGGFAESGARQVAEKIEELANRLDERGLEGTVDDVRRFARQRPGLFLLGATASGFLVARLGRGLKAAQEDGEDTSSIATPAQPIQPELPTTARAALEPTVDLSGAV